MGPFLPSLVTWMFLFKPFKRNVDLYPLCVMSPPSSAKTWTEEIDDIPYNIPNFFVTGESNWLEFLQRCR